MPNVGSSPWTGSAGAARRASTGSGATPILYVWTEDENYWPRSPAVPDDPFGDATGADLFAVNHAALTGARVRVPELLLLDLDGRTWTLRWPWSRMPVRSTWKI